MKKLLVIAAICVAGFAFSQIDIRENSAQAKCSIENRRGCCSHHSGVCGCSSGRALCCDGTLSPSCGCD